MCHNVPAIGGSSPMTELRGGTATRRHFHVVGGTTLFQMFSLPDHRCQAVIPAEANVIARRAPIPLFGGGTGRSRARRDAAGARGSFDRDRDGISGRAAVIVDKASGQRRVGRFG